jgi:hypothetical protein
VRGLNRRKTGLSLGTAVAAALVVLVLWWPGRGRAEPPKYRGLLGPKSPKVKKEGGKVLIWAGAEPGGKESHWYDFTGSPIPPEQLQFGIGKDRIRAIDDPLFVPPDDPRLLKLPFSPYGGRKKPKTNDDIMVIGFAAGEQARAYPVALLDHHELVNDDVGGKPVTVGW